MHIQTYFYSGTKEHCIKEFARRQKLFKDNRTQ